MAGWNLATVLETVAAVVPERRAIVQGDRSLTFSALEARAQALAIFLTASDLSPQATVAQYLRNCPEYLESIFGCLKGSFVPVNTNYRYGEEELVYLWTNAQVSAVVFHGSYVALIDRIRLRLPFIKLWLHVEDGSHPCPDWAVAYEAVTRSDPARVPAPLRPRSGDDLFLLYTGGTTGLPKGVMWRQDDLFVRLSTERGESFPDEPSDSFIRERILDPPSVHLPAGPLMHGAGLLTCFLVLSRGGAISLLQRVSFDPVDLLETIARDRVVTLMWVGDAFARPVLAELDAHPGRWDLSSLKTILSSGVTFSKDVKLALLKHLPEVSIADVFGSSETMSLGRSVTSRKKVEQADSVFKAKDSTRVLDEHGHDVLPGSGVTGLLAIGGRQPIGYYRDEVKTAATFRLIGGKRYVVPGDWALVEADGTIRVLGRGSECINTGGEKVFPEEIESTLKAHHAVYDAVVVGIPDERFGQAVAAAVQLRAEATATVDELVQFVKQRLAGYKAPRRLITVERMERQANGKADLPAIRRLFESSQQPHLFDVKAECP